MSNGCESCNPKHINQLNRLKKIEGQLKGVQKMIQEDRYCIDILIQIKSIKNALIRVEDNILKGHIETCVKEATITGSQEESSKKIEELIAVISKFK